MSVSTRSFVSGCIEKQRLARLAQRCNALFLADAAHQIVRTCPFVKQVPAVGKCIAPALERCNALFPADATHQIAGACPFVKQARPWESALHLLGPAVEFNIRQE